MSNLKDVREEKVLIKLNGENKELLYDLNALADLEEAYGSIDNWQSVLEKARFTDLRKFVHIGLLHNDEKITERQVGKSIGTNIFEIVEAISKALANAFPSLDDDGDENPKNEKGQAQG